jgi:OOP family OmpA-OmpF porin
MDRLPLCALFLSISSLAWADTPSKDISGVADPAALGRYDGSVIIDYASRPFDAASFPVEKWNRRDARPEKTLDVEGKVTRAYYLLPKERSPLEVLRNYQEVVKTAGGEILWECKTPDIRTGGDCGRNGGSYIRFDGKRSVVESIAAVGTLPADGNIHFKKCLYLGRNGDLRYFTGVVDKAGVKTHVGVAVWLRLGADGCRENMGPNKISLSNDDMKEQPVALVVTVEDKAREQKMVTVKADEMADAIKSGGKIALYGITFDFDKADIRPESKPQLDEIGGLLKADESLKLMITGHTDDQGGAAYNLDLSKRRADAVVEALIEQYGIGPDRLMAQGVGLAAPVASNETQEGRARNRRVELVRQ